MMTHRQMLNVKGETSLGNIASMDRILVRTSHFSLFTFHENHNSGEAVD
jgi:hypothetical protein